MVESPEQLKLENQICFPLYALSRLVIQKYKPLLDDLGVTYPQYLVLLVLWESDEVPVKFISEKLLLETNTLTPLLKRMANSGLITKTRSQKDERIVIISLTSQGKSLQQKAKDIPHKLIQELACLSATEEEILVMKNVASRMLASASQG